MLRKKDDGEIVLAAHGRWIAELRNTTRGAEQRLHLIEQRVTAFELQLVERARVQRELDAELAELKAAMRRLNSRRRRG